MGRRLRQWWRAAIAVAAIMSPHAAAADQPAHDVQESAGGHVFQLNVSDSFATTMGQIARGGLVATNWHLGFNTSREFY